MINMIRISPILLILTMVSYFIVTVWSSKTSVVEASKAFCVKSSSASYVFINDCFIYVISLFNAVTNHILTEISQNIIFKTF